MATFAGSSLLVLAMCSTALLQASHAASPQPPATFPATFSATSSSSSAPPTTAATAAAAGDTYDVLVYGSTPGGVMAAVAAARHGARTVLVDYAPRVGGVCSGGLGHTDKGNSVVIGGLAREFFMRNARVYDAGAAAPDFNLEPHVAQAVFEAMLADAGVAHVRTAGGAQLDSVQRLHAGDAASLSGITLEDGTAFAARVFVDGSYEGDLMARSGSSFTWGREANTTYNESYAGRREPFGRMDWAAVSPYEPDGTLLIGDGATTDALAAPLGAGDAMVQAYNFRLCVTKNTSNMAPFPKPAAYDRSEWALLFKLAATVPRGAQLGEYLNSFQPLHGGKFDMNNGGLISTDCAGCSWRYPNASYAERRAIHERHVEYQQGFMWTLANDAAIPAPVRAALREYGLCADEFTENGNWPEQLYVREARRLVGDAVFTQNDVLAFRKYSATNESAGMGSYNFDGHYSHRGPCLPNAARDGCTMITADSPPMTAAQRANSSLVWTGGEGYGAYLTATYELPYSALLPKRAQTSNLLCPLTPSVTHVALATVRMEPQFMILGQTAGTAAAIVAQQRKQQPRAAVQDVDRAALAGALLVAGQILSAAQFPPRPPPSHGYACGAHRCFGTVTGSTLAPTYANDSSCAAACAPLAAGEWLALKGHWRVDGASSMTAVKATYLKKSEEAASGLPAGLKKAVPIKTRLRLAKAAATADGAYWLATLAAADE